MPKRKKLMAVIFAAIILSAFIGSTAFAIEPEPRDWDKYTENGQLKDSATLTEIAVLIDAHTGTVLYDENGSSPRKFPASTTKIMTCLIVLENANLDDVVKVHDIDQERLDKEGSAVIGLENDEEITVRDLLYGLMLESGGDAAEALAMHVSGSVTSFVELMNQRANELGMTGTHFTNPIGLHDDQHYTTAMDLANLGFWAMKNDDFRTIVGTYKYDPPTTNVHGPENLWDALVWENRNKLVSADIVEDYVFNSNKYGHATGIKTGFTTPAQSTLVASAESLDGTQEVIAVVLYGTANGRFVDATTMFMYAFEFYDTINLMDFLAKNEEFKVHVDNAADNSTQDNLSLYPVALQESYMTDSATVITEVKNNPQRFTSEVTYIRDLTAPISKDEQVGVVKYYYNEQTEPVLVCNLLAQNTVEALPEVTPTPEPAATPVPTASPAPTIIDTVKSNPIYVIVGGAVIVILIILIIAVSSGKKRKQPARRAAGASSQTRGRRNDTRRSGGTNRGRGRRR